MGGLAGGGISLGTLSVAITAKVDEALRSLQGFGDDVAKLIDDQKSKWEGLADVGQSMTQLGGTLTAALTVPIAGIGAAAISSASDFESSLNKITAVSGTTGAELDTLRNLAMKLGADTKYSAQEAAEGMGNLAAAGLNTQQIMSAMPGVLDLAAAGELSVARAAEVTTETLGQFSLGADQAGRVADIMAKGAAASSISVADMAKTMTYAGATANSAGISLEELASATALLGNAGIKADMAGTSLRGMIGSLLDPSKRAAEALERLGVTTTDSAGKMLPLDNIFLQLQKSGADTADMFAIFDNASASAAATLTKNAGPAWASMTEQMINSEGAAKQMAATLNTGLAGAWEQMKGSLDTVLIALGPSLLPLMTKLIEVGTKFVNDWILPAVQAFGQLDPALQAAIIAFAAMAAAIGPILLIAGQMAVAISALMPVLAGLASAVGVSVAALAGWAVAIAAVVAALVALGVWVYSNWDQIVAFLSGIWDRVEAVWSGVWNSIVSAVTGIWESFKGLFGSYWEPIVKVLSAIWSGITAIWKAEWDLITGAVMAVWKAFVDTAQKVFGPAVEFLAGVWGKLKGAWDDAGKAADGAKKSTEAVTKAASDQTAAVKPATAEVKNLGAVFAETKGKAESGKKAVKDLGDEVEQTGKKHAAAKTEVKKFNDEILIEKLRIWQQEHKKLKEEIAQLEIVARKNAAAGFELNTAWEKASATLNMGAMSAKSVTAALPPMYGELDAAIARTKQLDADMKKVGATSKEEIPKLTASATEAAASTDTLKFSIGGLKEAALKDFTAFSTSATTACTSVGTSIGDLVTKAGASIGTFAKDLTSSLWEGGDSWGEKGKNLLESLGGSFKTLFTDPATGALGGLIQKGKELFESLVSSVLDTFIKPATQAIGDFIKGAIADLLGGKGFGGILDSIKEVGKGIGGILGAGGSAAEGIGGAGGAAGGAGGAAGGAIGGISGIVGAIGGIASAVSGIIGNFQMAGMNKTLDLIEKEVRYSQIHLSYILANTNDFFHRDWWKGYQNVADIRTAIVDSMEPQLARAAQHIDFFKQLAENDFKPALYSIAANTNAIMGATERIAVASERSVNMNLYGTDPEIVAARIAQQLRMQGGNG